MVTRPGGKVLVVEDDDSMRDAIEKLLAAAGFLCTAYASADAMLAQRVDEDLLCVVSDLRLPGMSGLELLGALRDRHVTAPFILITAHDSASVREAAMSHGAAAYLAKPFRGTALLQSIEAAIAPSTPSSPS